MKLIPEKRTGGWQCWVDLYPDYVIKTIKKEGEMKEAISRYLNHIGKPNELEKRTKQMLEDIRYSKRLIKCSNIPRRLLGNAEFLEDGTVKQGRALVLSQFMKEAKTNEAKRYLDKTLVLLTELWKYGLHEKTFKFNSNFGILDSKLVLLDLFELTGNKTKVAKQIRNRAWYNPTSFQKYLIPELTNYLVERANNTLTIENLNKYWKAKR